MVNIESLSNKLSMIGYKCKLNGIFLVATRKVNEEYETILYILKDAYSIPQAVIANLLGDVTITGSGKLQTLLFRGTNEFHPVENNTIKRLTLDIDISHLTSLKYAFAYLKSLEEIKFKRFDTSDIRTIRGIFASCSNLKYVDFSGLDFSKLQDIGEAFRFCVSLKSVEFSGCKTGSLDTLDYMFSDCWSIQYIDLNGLDLRTVSNFDAVFMNCGDLKRISIPDIGEGKKIDSYIPMFRGCISLTKYGIDCVNDEIMKYLT